jgi:hypothetical protein
MTLIGETPTDHRRFWGRLLFLLIGLAVSHWLMLALFGISRADLLDVEFGALIGFLWGWR